MTDRELMKLALEALELHAKQYPHMQKGYTVDAIAALRERLSGFENGETHGRGCAECGKSGGWALYCVACAERLVRPCPNCASLEAQNTELDAKLAQIEQAQHMIECTRCGKFIGV